MKLILICLWSLFFVSCVTQPPGAGLDQVVSEVVTKKDRTTLSWESKAGREAWSDKWTSLIEGSLGSYTAAGDITRICPKFKSLTADQKVKAIGEFWVSVAYYESGFNPSSQAVDVGSKENRDSWSVGLYQLSVRDSANKKGPNYSFEQLNTALPNIHLANVIMTTQIKNCGKLILENSSKCRYWAVILDGNKYSKASQIIARTQSNASFCK